MRWQQRSANPLSQDLIEQFQLSPLTAKLFSLRGINTAKKLDFWFNANEGDLADPYLMHDMDKAVARINRAIDNGEKITIYGDYDADGITATTIMTETLSILGADVHYFIPDRFQDGYGPSMQRYHDIVADGTKLIITVDNGITGVNEVAYAKSKGVDTIVTDHHTFQEKLPDAAAIVHCNFPGQKYPFDDYCGAGVAYTICRALMQDPMPELLDLALIGTIGDMVKVSGEGHIIVKRGLEVLNQTERPGLRALIKAAGLKLGEIDEEDVGFGLAPRLNAVGRLANANMAVQLLLSDDEQEAAQLADKIEELNDQRKKLTSSVYDKCLQLIKANSWQRAKTLVVFDPSFHEGVLGLVANKLVEKTHKPAIVLTQNDAGLVKGSGRSIPGFNLFDALDPLKQDLFTSFGGHDFACGLSLKAANISKLRHAFEKSFHVKGDLAKQDYDFELPLKELKNDVLSAIRKVGPFGTDNPRPLFSLSNFQVSHFFKMGAKKEHIKFSAVKDGASLAIVGFNRPYLNHDLLPFLSKIYFSLSVNTYKNKSSLQGLMAGQEFAAPQLAVKRNVIDLRREGYIMGFADRYLLFNEKNKGLAENALGIAPEKIALVADYQASGEKAVLLDVPKSSQELKIALKHDYQQLYLRFLLDQLPVAQIPQKSDFAAILKYIYAHPSLTPEDYRQLVPYFGLDFDSILFILRVFFELKFINLDQGKLIPVSQPQKTPLTQSRYLQATRSQIKFTNSLRRMPSNELVNYIKNMLN